MLSIAGQRILLCDSTKLEKDSFVNFAAPEQIDILMTDSVEPAILSTFGDLGLEVQYPDSSIGN